MNNKLNDSGLLECVTAAAVLLIGILTPLSCVIDIVSLFGRSGNYIPPLALLYNVGMYVGSFVTATIPMMILAFIVFRGRHRDAEKRKVVAGTLVFYAVGNLIVSGIATTVSVSSFAKSFSRTFSDEVRKLYISRIITSVAGNVFIELLIIAAALLILDALWQKIKWKSFVLPMIVFYALLVVSFIARGFSSNYYYVFLLLLAVYIREELSERTTPVNIGAVGAFASAGLALLFFIAGTVGSVVLLVIGHGDMYADNDAVNVWFTLKKVIEVIVFLVSLTVPLLIMGRKFPPAESKAVEE